MSMTVAQAQAELATIVAAIGEYVSGTRRKRFKVMSAGLVREKEFSDSDKLFEYLVARRKELEDFLAGQETCVTTIAATFIKNKNIPMVFKRNG